MRRTGTRAIVAAAALGLALTACSGGDGHGQPSATEDADGCTNAQQVASWPMKRRLGQMMMGAVLGEGGDEAIDTAVRSIAKGQVGGVNFLGSTSDPYDNKQLARAVDAGGQVPPFLAVDQEGGRVQRLAEITGFIDSPREMAKSKSPEQVQRLARRIGRIMSKHYLNMNLAPVVDVSDQPADAVIGNRSFSNNPQVVVKYAGAFAAGLRESGVIPVLKHFPGLGSGSGNTDFESAKTPRLAKLERRDLVPYESLLADEPVAVMVTNAKVPDLTDGRPASVSKATYALLREHFGYDGVIMTDSLSAAAVSGAGIDTAVRRAIVAGADIALWDDLTSAPDIRDALMRAVRSGKLPEEQVNASVTRILDLKQVDLCAGR